jgi:hypothetical protein
VHSNVGIPASARTIVHENKEIVSRKEKEHNRSNSTISKKSAKDIKNCFKIDLSKLQAKE